MKPDEMRLHIKQIHGLDEFLITDHDHLIRLLGGKDKEFKFKEKKLKTEDVLRIFPANYFPITSEEDLIAKAVGLVELGREGFQTAAAAPPENESGPPAEARAEDMNRPQDKKRPHEVHGHPK